GTTFEKLANPLLYFLIALIPFSVRHVFSSTWNFQTGAYSDFTSLSLYISDIVLVALLFCFTWNYLSSRLARRSTSVPISRIWLAFAAAAIGWLLLELFVQPKGTLPVQLYFSVRVALLIAFAAVV